MLYDSVVLFLRDASITVNMSCLHFANCKGLCVDANDFFLIKMKLYQRKKWQMKLSSMISNQFILRMPKLTTVTHLLR